MTQPAEPATSPTRPRDLPAWVWLPLPLLVYPLVALAAAVPTLHPLYDWLMTKEGGVELLGVAALLASLMYSLPTIYRHRHKLPARWLKVWFALVMFAMFFLAGEELSWGQHLGFWDHEDVPDAIKAVNDQNETNLHNIGGNALDVNPTNAVVLATFVAFIINPIYLKWRGKPLILPAHDPGHWFWPTPAALPAAIGVLLIRFPQRIYRWTAGEIPDDVSVYWRHSEVHECYIALLFATYLAAAAHRLRNTPP
ncbi:MAG: hypothetical protein GVY24_06425 [Planctomycetes bacterium]|jgi:hypothetical protein|nr:hypothetical protein [Planctomycetota bacterium]